MAFDQNIYFGAPGALTILPHPRGGVKTTRSRPRQEFSLGNGEMRARSILQGSRLFELTYDNIDYATHANLLAYDQGHMGPGPFVLLDPGQRNMLTVNQSSATSQTNDATNFTVAGSGAALASTTAQVLGFPDAPRSLQWTFNFTPAASGAYVLSLDPPYAGWPGVPVVSGRSLCFSCQVRGGGTDAISTIRPELRWFDVSQSFLSSTTGAPVTTASGSWAAMSVAGAPPANSVYVQPRVQYVSGAAAGGIVYLARFQLEEGATVGTWRPGTGVSPVTVVGYNDDWPWLYPTEVRERSTFQLRQEGN